MRSPQEGNVFISGDFRLDLLTQILTEIDLKNNLLASLNPFGMFPLSQNATRISE